MAGAGVVVLSESFGSVHSVVACTSSFECLLAPGLPDAGEEQQGIAQHVMELTTAVLVDGRFP